MDEVRETTSHNWVLWARDYGAAEEPRFRDIGYHRTYPVGHSDDAVEPFVKVRFIEDEGGTYQGYVPHGYSHLRSVRPMTFLEWMWASLTEDARGRVVRLRAEIVR